MPTHSYCRCVRHGGEALLSDWLTPLRLVYCQRCGNPIAEVALVPGAAIRVKCHRCGYRTVIALEERAESQAKVLTGRRV